MLDDKLDGGYRGLGTLSAHYEHSLVITEGEPEILTEWENRKYADFLDVGN